MLKSNCSKVAKFVLILLVAPLVFVAHFTLQKAYAQTSSTINFQGKIVRNDTGYEGLNVTTGSPACVKSGPDECDFQVKYYSASTSGTLYFTETYTDVEIGQYGGIFNLSLGAGTPTTGAYSSLDAMIKAQDSVYVEILFSPAGTSSFTETFSRMPLQASAYAIRSEYAKMASGAFEFENAEDYASTTRGLTTPASNGMVYYDTTAGVLKLYSGGVWQNLATGGSSIWGSNSISSYSHYPSQFMETSGIATLSNFGVDATVNRAWVHGASSRTGFSVYSNYSGATDWPLVTFKADASNFGNSILQLTQDGTGNILEGLSGSTPVFNFDKRGDLHLSNNGVNYFGRFPTPPTTGDLFPGSGEGCLYNVAGTLYWDGACNYSGVPINTGSSSKWTDAGSFTYLTSTTDDILFGGNSTATATFFFDVDASSGNYLAINNAANTQRLFTIDSSGNVGIGTATPGSKLDIGGANSNITNSTGNITITPNQNLILGSGNFGVGTATPNQKLSVAGTFGIIETGASPTYYTIFQGGDQNGNITYTLPTTSTTGILANNGSGVLSWATLSSLGGVTGTGTGSGTAGQITFWSGTSSITGSNNFWWDNANQRLGIGTSSPQASLDIAGATSEIANTSGDITITPAANLIVSSGRVGIGAPTPNYKLHVSETLNQHHTTIYGYAAQSSTSTDYLNIGIEGLASGANSTWGRSIGVWGHSNKANTFRSIGVVGSLSTTLSIPSFDFNTAIWGDGSGLGYSGIFTGGNVGIGVTNPSYTLEVNGDALMNRAFVTGRSSSWGSSDGVNTGGVNVTMGTSTGATWLISGTSDETFRVGLQALDSDGTLKIYSNGSAVTFAGTSLTAGAISGSRITATQATGTSPFVVTSTTVVSNLNADLLDGLTADNFLRSDVDDNLTAAIIVPTANRDEGMFGTYDSTKTQHIWSMGVAYRNAANGATFGNLHGLAYKHTNNTTGGTMAGGHQMVWVVNGTGTAALGTGIWTSGSLTMGSYLYHNNDTNTYLGFPADDNINFVTAGSERMRIASNGNVGIRTTGPAIHLAIGDTDTGLNWVSDGNIDIKTNSESKLKLRASALSGFTLGGYSANFYTNSCYDTTCGVDGVQINGNGWVKILAGTNWGGAYNQIAYTQDAGIFFSLGSQNTGGFVIAPHGSSAGGIRIAGNTGYVGIGVQGPYYRLELPNTGDIGGRGRANQWTTYSDITLKENIEVIKSPLDKVLALKPVTYNWVGTENMDSGFVAQWVEPITPELVSTGGDGIKSIDYGKFTPYLAGAIQEMYSDFGSRITYIEGELEKIYNAEEENYNIASILELNQADKTETLTESGWYRISQLNNNDDYAKIKVNNSTLGSSQNLILSVDTVGDNNNVNVISNFTTGGYDINKARINEVDGIKYLEVYLGNVNNNSIKVSIQGEKTNWIATNIVKVEDGIGIVEYAFNGVLFGVSDAFSVKKDSITTSGTLLTSSLTSNIGNSSNRWNDIYTKGTIRLGSGNSEGGIRYNVEKKRLEFSNDGAIWVEMGDLTSSVVISPEYSGAILYADGTDNYGRMTSDAIETGGVFKNYYEWKSDRETLQDYDILVRITLPTDFVSWKDDAISLDFMTENSASVANNKVDIALMGNSGIDGEVKDGISKLPGSWERVSIKSTNITQCKKAGDSCTVRLSMHSRENYFVRVGDISLNYNRGL
ncbi:MAG: tail fiber domain-containing protein [Candidatus Dojkabacteria bacterium]